VGQKRLHQGILQFQRQQGRAVVDIQIEWKAYQLDPNTAVEGEDFDAYNMRRWGGSEWTKDLFQQGHSVGAPFGQWKIWPHTLRAHQWIAYGVQHHQADTDHCNATLFQAVYENGLNISDVETLVQLGRTEFGETCSTDKLRDHLEQNRGLDSVLEEVEHYRNRYNITSVPRFIIALADEQSSSKQGELELSNVKDAAEFCDAFAEILKD
jgi:predicted DsbA family dithiol-disulfide isomerase